MADAHLEGDGGGRDEPAVEAGWGDGVGAVEHRGRLGLGNFGRGGGLGWSGTEFEGGSGGGGADFEGDPVTVHGVGGEAAGEGEVAGFIGDKGEGLGGVGEAFEEVRDGGPFEVGRGHLDFFQGFLFDDHEAVGNGAGVDIFDGDFPVFGDEIGGVSFGVTVEIHAVIFVIPDGHHDEIDTFGGGAEAKEVGFGEVFDEFHIAAGAGDSRVGVLMSGRR